MIPIKAALARSTIAAYALLLFSFATTARAVEDQQQPFAVDESLWAVFYDLPSRRFRAIKEAHLRRDWPRVAADLNTSANYLRIEAERSNVAPALVASAEALQRAAVQLDDSAWGANLDRSFADAHWVLAQHFLGLAVQARDDGRVRDAGWYLTATAHHMERTALWSRTTIDRKQVNTVDSLRRQASKLREIRTEVQRRNAFRNRPIENAITLLHGLAVPLQRSILTSFTPRAD